MHFFSNIRSSKSLEYLPWLINFYNFIGGFTAAILDSTSGMLGTITNNLNPVATAYLNIQYKKPLKVN
jgi:hypothetical protein